MKRKKRETFFFYISNFFEAKHAQLHIHYGRTITTKGKIHHTNHYILDPSR